MERRRKIESAKRLLLQSLRNPNAIYQLSIKEGELLMRLARCSKLVAHLGSRLQREKGFDPLPDKLVEHLQAAQALTNHRKRLALWEVDRLWRAFLEKDIPVVLLKGGAYLLMELPLAEGRLVSDIDLLVERKHLQRVENILLDRGWRAAELDEYDQKYYRKWMHEIPPLSHRDRLVEVDIHHTILPLTSRLQPDPALLLEDAVDSGKYGFKVLAPCDMFLHSSVHLFYNAELNSGDLRDLVDQDELIRAFSQQNPSFWNRLIERAKVLQLVRPLYYTLYFTRKLLATPIPDNVWIMLDEGKPPKMVHWLMDLLVPLAMLPENPDFSQRSVGVARWLLYVRSHYLRMPLYLLIPHLFRKSGKRFGFHNEEPIA